MKRGGWGGEEEEEKGNACHQALLISNTPFTFPPSFLFLLSPYFSRGQNAEKPVLRSLLHGNVCYAGYSPLDVNADIFGMLIFCTFVRDDLCFTILVNISRLKNIRRKHLRP